MSRKSSRSDRKLTQMTKSKKEAYERGKQEQVTLAEYIIETMCRGGIRKAKAHLELKIARNVKHNKKHFCRYIMNKIETRTNVGPLPHEIGAW